MKEHFARIAAILLSRKKQDQQKKRGVAVPFLSENWKSGPYQQEPQIKYIFTECGPLSLVALLAHGSFMVKTKILICYVHSCGFLLGYYQNISRAF